MLAVFVASLYGQFAHGAPVSWGFSVFAIAGLAILVIAVRAVRRQDDTWSGEKIMRALVSLSLVVGVVGAFYVGYLVDRGTRFLVTRDATYLCKMGQRPPSDECLEAAAKCRRQNGGLESARGPERDQDCLRCLAESLQE